MSSYYFDWRNRQVASKAGVQASENTADSTNRPIFFEDYNNLDEVTEEDEFDGDAVNLTDANNDGVPDKPDKSLLRAQTISSTDDQGRPYETETKTVNPATGVANVTAPLKSKDFYNHRGQVGMSIDPNGTVTKTLYDSAGRVWKTYVTDGGVTKGIAVHQRGLERPPDLSNDIVLSQTENSYDADGRLIFVTTRQRLPGDDNSGAPAGLGELGDDSGPSGTPGPRFLRWLLLRQRQPPDG